MAGGDQRGSMASPFDDLLKKSRDRFDDLFGDSGPEPYPGPGKEPEFPSPAEPVADERPEPEEDWNFGSGSLNARQYLDDRFGGGWAHEIVERRLERNQAIVLCKLTIEDTGVSKSQFGQATIERGSLRGERQAAKLQGTANGVSFWFQPDEAGKSVTAEEDAYRRAEDEALAKCAEML